MRPPKNFLSPEYQDPNLKTKYHDLNTYAREFDKLVVKGVYCCHSATAGHSPQEDRSLGG